MKQLRRIPFDVPGVTLELDEGIDEIDVFPQLFVTAPREAMTEQVIGRCRQIARDLGASLCIGKPLAPPRIERARANRAAIVDDEGRADVGSEISEREARERGLNVQGVEDFPVTVSDGVLLCPRCGGNIRQRAVEVSNQKDPADLTTVTLVADGEVIEHSDVDLAGRHNAVVVQFECDACVGLLCLDVSYEKGVTHMKWVGQAWDFYRGEAL
jgi:hypothetical protein